MRCGGDSGERGPWDVRIRGCGSESGAGRRHRSSRTFFSCPSFSQTSQLGFIITIHYLSCASLLKLIVVRSQNKCSQALTLSLAVRSADDFFESISILFIIIRAHENVMPCPAGTLDSGRLVARTLKEDLPLGKSGS